MARRAYHHGDLRAAALAAATALVDAGAPLGIRELGRRLGVSHVAVHYHFASIEAVEDALAAIWFGDLDRAMAAAERRHRDEPRARFHALGAAYVRYALTHPARFRVLFRGRSAGLAREAEPAYRRVLEAVVACRPRADPGAVTMLAWSAMHGLAMLWIDGALAGRLVRRELDALIANMAAVIGLQFRVG